MFNFFELCADNKDVRDKTRKIDLGLSKMVVRTPVKKTDQATDTKLKCLNVRREKSDNILQIQ